MAPFIVLAAVLVILSVFWFFRTKDDFSDVSKLPGPGRLLMSVASLIGKKKSPRGNVVFHTHTKDTLNRFKLLWCLRKSVIVNGGE